jgi:hypothetical protein
VAKVEEKLVNYDPKNKVVKEYVNTNTTGGSARSQWWKDEPAEAYRNITAVTQSILQNQKYKEVQQLRYVRLYANMEIMGFGAGLYDRAPQNNPISSRISYNVVKSCVDTAASKIAKMRPRIVALTSGGSWKQQQMAKKLAKFIEGAFGGADVYENMNKAFVDSCVLGTGAVKFFHDGETIKTERVFYNELLIDAQEGVYSKPRQMHQVKYLSRDILIDMFPEHAELILKAQSGKTGDMQGLTTADFIIVRESWHLRSGKKATDGAHIISINNCTLFHEQYDRDYFPFIFLRWCNKLLGFEGSGIGEELIGLQLEINKLLRNIQQAQNLACVPRVFIEAGSQVVEDHINNQIGAVIRYTGNMPVIAPASAMPTELYQHLETLFRKSYEITGISQLSAGSKKPAGLDSGVAIREYQDIETERFSNVAQRYEDAFVLLAERFMDLASDLADMNPNFSIKVSGSKLLETIKWKDVKIAENDYVFNLYPASLLPTQPAGRLQKVQELLQSGLINQTTAKALLDFPDIEDAMDNELAAYNDIHMVIEDMLDSGVYSAPEPFMNPPLCIEICQSQYLRAKVAKVEEEKLELLRRFMEDSAALIQQAQPEAPAAAPAPLALPEALPTSPLIPQV